MPDETKKYIVNIESNLKKYADEAAEAKKKVDELKAANDALMQSGKASAAEIEASKAALKNANDEYRKAQSLLKTAIANNQSETGSRKQLSEQLKLQEQALGKLGNAYIKDAQGVMRLNPLYTEQRNQIAATKQKILDYDKSLNDGRSNIGRYGESVKEAFSSAGKSILSMISPMALVAAGIAVARKIFEGFKEAIMSTTGAINALNIVNAINKQLFYDLAVNGRLSAESMRQVAAAAAELNKLRTEEYKDSFEISKINREEQAVREQSIDRTRTHEQRLESLNKVKELESQKTKIQVGHLQKELKANLDIMEQRPKDEKQRQKVWELMTKINDAYAAEDQAMRRVETQRTGFVQEALDARKKLWDDYLAWIDKENERKDKEREDQIKQEATDEVTGVKHYETLKKEQEKSDFNLIKGKKSQYKGLFDMIKEVQTHTVDLLKSTNEQAGESDTRLKDLRVYNQELIRDSLFSGLDAMAIILGRQTEMGKAFAVAAAIIDTYGAANKALNDPTIPSTIARIIVMAGVILTGLANVKQILSVKVGKSVASATTAPTSIVTTPVVQKSFATPVGSTILTQPQLSQTQLNALPAQGLTADDMAKAISKLTIVTTIEDINARQESTNKIVARANI
jgi:hypothetical protein